jgi:hypothetical protein
MSACRQHLLVGQLVQGTALAVLSLARLLGRLLTMSACRQHLLVGQQVQGTAWVVLHLVPQLDKS